VGSVRFKKAVLYGDGGATPAATLNETTSTCTLGKVSGVSVLVHGGDDVMSVSPPITMTVA